MDEEVKELMKYKLLFEKSPDPIVLVGGNGEIKMANPAFLSLVGEKADVVIGKSFLDYVVFEDKDQLFQYHKKRRADPRTAPLRYEFGLLTKKGEKKIIDRTVILLPDGETTLSILRDITPYKQLEIQLIQAQKMEAIGRLVGTIAHDFNNVLQAIIGYSQLLLSKINKDDPRWNYVYQINTISNEAANLVKQLLLFSRKQPIETIPVNINQVIDNMKEMIVCIIGENIECKFSLDRKLREVEADITQIEQIIMNLITNAKEAMPGGGRLIVETKNLKIDKAFASMRGIEPGDYVMLGVADTGKGMDEKIKQHCFEPFFTTKKDGTGLGLSTVYGIVNRMKGCVRVYSELYKGTIIKIYLPQAKTAVLSSAKPEITDISPGGGKTVLVVEDSKEIREFLKEMLETLGYSAVFAKNGAEALEQAKKYPVDVLLTDIVIPGMNGYELARHLYALNPEIKVVYMSGYPKGVLTEMNMKKPRGTFLQKPFTMEQLAVKLKETAEETD